MGIGGLALASSISAIATSVLLFISLRKKIGRIGMKNTIITFIKVAIASIIMGLIIKFSYYEIVNLGMNIFEKQKQLIAISCIGSTLIGLIIYIILTLIFNIRESKEVAYMIKSKFRQIIYKR